MKIQKPLLASAFDPDKAQFPYLATPKVDGIRFLMIDGVAVSRSFKPIRNEHIQDWLQAHLPDGIDGELTCGTNFQDSTSGIMRIKGEPDFHVWIFDYVDAESDEIAPYEERMQQLQDMGPLYDYEGHERVTVLYPKPCPDHTVLQILDDWWTSKGFEGVMLRAPGGTYKFGRASVRENTLLKVKRFRDDEGTVIGFVEKMSNQNEAVRNAIGGLDRKGGKAGHIPCDTLGSFILDYKGQTLKCGSGLNDEMRKEIWENRDKYLGKLVKFKSMEVGVKDLPRHPIFLGFRDEDDIS